MASVRGGDGDMTASLAEPEKQAEVPDWQRNGAPRYREERAVSRRQAECSRQRQFVGVDGNGAVRSPQRSKVSDKRNCRRRLQSAAPGTVAVEVINGVKRNL